MIYFARNGYSGTKISDLSKFIGIGQGTLYSYFPSKENLFKVIVNNATVENENKLLQLKRAPINAADKIMMLSINILEIIKEDTSFSYMFVLYIQYSMENNFNNSYTETNKQKPNQILSEIILDGQKEETIVPGDTYELADLYWSMVHIIALKKVFDKNHEVFQAKQLARLLLKDEVINPIYNKENKK